MNVFKTYYELIKPGIVYGNALPAIGAFVFASGGHATGALFLAMLVGLSLVIAGGCVWNNYLDRDIDALMERTKHRALVRGALSARAAAVYGCVLAALGLFILAAYTNLLAAGVALFGLAVYVGAYTLLAKRRTIFGTHVGALAGAVPPVVGYVAVTDRLDLAAFILFLTLALWQMPHFFAIAIRRAKDYQAARIPALPLLRDAREALLHMRFYIAAFTLSAFTLSLAGYASRTYAGIVVLAGFGWLYAATREDPQGEAWGRRVFLASLLAMLGFSLALIVSPFTL